MPFSVALPLGLAPKNPRKAHKLQVDADQSYPLGSSVNDGIPHDELSVRYDEVQDLAWYLRAFTALGVEVSSRHARRRDMDGAFRVLPAHPVWMLCQIVMVDRRVVFGGGSSPRIWSAVRGST